MNYVDLFFVEYCVNFVHTKIKFFVFKLYIFVLALKNVNGRLVGKNQMKLCISILIYAMESFMMLFFYFFYSPFLRHNMISDMIQNGNICNKNVQMHLF